MKISPRTILAAALLTALPMTGAFACTVSMWDDATANALAGNPKGRDSEPAVPRYSGTCGLKAATAGTSYVTDNTPNNEAIYRARFYVFTGSATNNPKFFSATAASDGGGTEAFSIALSGSAMAFTVNGTSVAGTHAIAPNRWYGVEVLYRAGGPFTAKVRGNRALTESTYTSAGNAGAVNVGSARLGVLNAANNATSLAFDAFESTRSADTEIGRLCPGDANGSGSITAGDISAIMDEIPSNGTYALGQPDCTEDGNMTAGDVSCAMDRFTIPNQRDCSVR